MKTRKGKDMARTGGRLEFLGVGQPVGPLVTVTLLYRNATVACSLFPFSPCPPPLLPLSDLPLTVFRILMHDHLALFLQAVGHYSDSQR